MANLRGQLLPLLGGIVASGGGEVFVAALGGGCVALVIVVDVLAKMGAALTTCRASMVSSVTLVCRKNARHPR